MHASRRFNSMYGGSTILQLEDFWFPRDWSGWLASSSGSTVVPSRVVDCALRFSLQQPITLAVKVRCCVCPGITGSPWKEVSDMNDEEGQCKLRTTRLAESVHRAACWYTTILCTSISKSTVLIAVSGKQANEWNYSYSYTMHCIQEGNNEQ
jgi:hypothetical protein